MVRNRRWIAALIALTLLFSLSGCVKIDMDMNVRANNTLDGTFIMAVDKDLLTGTGVSEQDLLKQLQSQGPFSGDNAPKHGSVSQRRYDSGGKVGQIYTFKGLPLSEFGGSADGFAITRKGDRFIVSGVVDMTTDTPLDPQSKALGNGVAKTAEIRIRLTFPGEVLKSNGKIDGRSVTWHPKIGEKTPVTAEARTKAIIPVLLAVVGGAVAVLLILGVIVFLLLFRRSRRRRGAVINAGYGAPYAQPQAYPPGPYPPGPQVPPPDYRRPDATQPLPRVDPSRQWPP